MTPSANCAPPKQLAAAPMQEWLRFTACNGELTWPVIPAALGAA